MNLTLFQKSTRILGLLLLFATGISWAQISITGLPYTKTDNFNTYNGSGSGTLPAGWTLSGAANYRGTGNGSSNTGGFYAFGTGSDYSLGALRSSSNDYTYTVSFTNNSGSTITSLTISWNYEQWRYANNSGWNCTGTGALASNATLNGKDFAGVGSGTAGSVTTTAVSSFTLSGLSIASGQAFGITWVTTDQSSSDNGVAIDDFSIQASGAPVLQNQTITFGTLSNQTYGVAPYTLSASSTSGLTVAFASSNTNVATVSGNTVTIVGAGSANITASQAGNSTYNPASNVVRMLTVNKKDVTVDNAAASNKIYDRSNAAAISGTLNGLVHNDAIGLNGGGTFANALAGTGKTVTANLSLSGTKAASYNLIQPIGLTADITPKDLTISNVSVADKEYDGNTGAVFSGSLSGVISPDNVELLSNVSFESPFAGIDVPVIADLALSGADSGNYNLVQPSALTADIIPKALTVANAVAQNKVFDGNTDAIISGTLEGIIAPDEVIFVGTGTFASPNIGLNIPVTSTSSLSGDAANYTLVQPTGLSANISGQALLPQTITFDPLPNVVYGSADFALNAISDSGLAISYSSSDENVAAVSGNTITIVGVGTTTITANQSGDLTYDAAEPVQQTLNILPKALSISDALASDKTYDGNNNASVSGMLSGVVGSDDVTFAGSGSFAQTTVGNDIAVTTHLTLAGTDAIRYTLTQPSGLLADITPKALDVFGATAADKTYDATTNATINGATLNGIVGSDDVEISGSGAFTSADAANNIPVTASLVLSGADAGNYTLIQPTGLQADITPAALSVSGLTADHKVYDRTTIATISGTAVLNGIIGSDDVTVSGTATGSFNNRNVGTAKTVTLGGLTLSGAQASNYSLSGASTSADITLKSITISGAVAQDKPFDGNTDAVITGTLSGVISPDAVTLAGTGTFATSAVGTNIAVTSTAGLTGPDAGNYVINPQPTGLTANILSAPVALAVWTYEPLIGAISTPTPNTGTGTSALVGSMSGLSMATGMNTASGCGAQTSGTQAWAIASAAPGTNESSGARFSTSTVGYQNVKVTWEQRWSNASANTLRLQYTTNGTNWTNFTMTADNTTFCLGSLNNGRFESNATGDQYRRISVDLSSIAAINDNPNFGVRIVAAHYQNTGQFRQTQTPGSVASGGTWRFDNVKFEATEIPQVPPTASVLSGTATICAGESTNLSVNITDGTAPFTVVYSDGTDNFTVNNYASGSNIPVAPTASATYTLVSVTDANGLVGTGNSGSAVIGVNQLHPFYADVDGDGYGTGSTVNICAVNANTPPTGYAVLDGDCNDGIAAIHPNAVEIPYNGVDDDCDGSIDETGTVTTTLLASACGATLTSIGSLIGIQTVGGHNITAYRIRITNGPEVQVIEKTVPHFSIPQFSAYAYATTYTVDIQLQRAGIWQASWGASCLVSTPAILEEGGAASVSPSQCGITLPKINTLVATTSIQGVTGYRFRITNMTDPLGPNAVQTIDRAQNWFSLQMLTRYNYGTRYRIEVAVKTTGAFGGFGSPCEVSSPAAPALINCGGIVASGTSAVAATSVEGASQYRFQIVRMSDNASTTIDRSQNWFIFNSIPAAAFTAGELYNVRVAVLTKGSWSPFGDVCEITAPGGLAKGALANDLQKDTIAVSTEFKATAYPNPFTSAFNLDIVSGLNEKVQVKVYDMIGRLIESGEVETDFKSFGSQYPSGVYNIIVSQGNNIKTFRVVKR